jgi:hypothetical protein
MVGTGSGCNSVSGGLISPSNVDLFGSLVSSPKFSFAVLKIHSGFALFFKINISERVPVGEMHCFDYFVILAGCRKEFNRMCAWNDRGSSSERVDSKQIWGVDKSCRLPDQIIKPKKQQKHGVPSDYNEWV